MSFDPNVVQWFNSVDRDRSGRITASELQAALLTSNGRHFTESACRLMIGLYDNMGTGSIDVNGFGLLYNLVTQGLNAFLGYDRDQSGYINYQEFEQALQAMGYRFSPQVINMLGLKLGEPGGRGLSADGFITACILLQKFTEGFRQRETQTPGVITIGYEDFILMILQCWS